MFECVDGVLVVGGGEYDLCVGVVGGGGCGDIYVGEVWYVYVEKGDFWLLFGDCF